MSSLFFPLDPGGKFDVHDHQPANLIDTARLVKVFGSTWQRSA